MPKEVTNAARKAPAKGALKAQLARIGMHVGLAIFLVGGGAAGYYFIHRYVEHDVIFPATARPPQVVLKERPPWMSDELHKRILDLAQPIGPSSPTDRRTVEAVYTALRASPWVKQVRQVRRLYVKQPGDTIEIDCEFRAPIALVRAGDYYWAVDNDGVALPDPYALDCVKRVVFADDGRVSLRVIEGVSAWPPDPGHKWEGDDVLAALDLVKLLYGKPFANEIVIIDASNFRRQRSKLDAQLVLITTHKTRIEWGEPVQVNFHADVAPQRKLTALECLYKEKGRVDGGFEWIDIRKDDILTPETPGGGARATTN